MPDWTCQCGGSGWVCERHHLVPWRNGDGCCGAPGMPCSQCNTDRPPRYAPDTYPVGFDDEPRAAAPMPLLDQPSLRSQVSHYGFVPHNPGQSRVELDDTIDAMKFASPPIYRFTDAPEFTVLDYEEPLDRGIVLVGDKFTYETISRQLFRASARQAWGQSVTDAELQDEALDDLYHELGIKREDR